MQHLKFEQKTLTNSFYLLRERIPPQKRLSLWHRIVFDHSLLICLFLRFCIWFSILLIEFTELLLVISLSIIALLLILQSLLLSPTATIYRTCNLSNVARWWASSIALHLELFYQYNSGNIMQFHSIYSEALKINYFSSNYHKRFSSAYVYFAATASLCLKLMHSWFTTV